MLILEEFVAECKGQTCFQERFFCVLVFYWKAQVQSSVRARQREGFVMAQWLCWHLEKVGVLVVYAEVLKAQVKDKVGISDCENRERIQDCWSTTYSDKESPKRLRFCPWLTEWVVTLLANSGYRRRKIWTWACLVWSIWIRTLSGVWCAVLMWSLELERRARMIVALAVRLHAPWTPLTVSLVILSMLFKFLLSLECPSFPSRLVKFHPMSAVAFPPCLFHNGRWQLNFVSMNFVWGYCIVTERDVGVSAFCVEYWWVL